MKPERIVVLCICAVLLGTLYAQWMAWACRVAIPSMSPAGRPLPWSERQGYIGDLLTAAWPPLGFMYGEAQRLRQRADVHSDQDSVLSVQTPRQQK